jgi:hypothetical protein
MLRLNSRPIILNEVSIETFCEADFEVKFKNHNFK